MNSNSVNNKIIAKNTLFLYIRTIFMLALNLYTSRVMLNALGVENYGVINVIVGFVSMFSLISGSLSSACQRFITFELGKEKGNIRQVFSSSLLIHLFLALSILIILEIVGLFFIDNILNLPNNKQLEIHLLFQCSIISFVINLINVPYNALIVAHEKMKAFAYISIFEATLRLLTVLIIFYIRNNELIYYAVFTLLSSLIIRIIYLIYAKLSLGKECKFQKISSRESFVNISKFASWAFLGNTATILSNQGVNMILNIFMGVTLNAARGIASQVESAVNQFTGSFTTAINPQITKSLAQNKEIRTTELLDIGIRMSFFLIMIITVPIIIATGDILNIWLGVYPEYTIPFVRLTLLSAIVQTTSSPLMTAIYATGKIKYYQIVVGGLVLMNLPICYFSLKLGYSPINIYIISTIIYIIAFIIRIYFLNNQTNINVAFIVKRIIGLLPIGSFAMITNYYLYGMVSCFTIVHLLIFSALSLCVTITIFFILGINKKEKYILIYYIKNKFSHDY